MLGSRRLVVAVVAGALLAAAAAAGPAEAAGADEGILRVSTATGGGQGDGVSRRGAVSGNGQWVAFSSEASTLVAGDGNGVEDVFVRDVQAGTTWRISTAKGGGDADGLSTNPAISGDGRYVVFESAATDLVDGDTNGTLDVFVHDIWTATTKRVSLDENGAQLDDASGDAAISPDGGYVAFVSHAGDVVAGDTNGVNDVFLRDLATGGTKRVSVSSSGAEADAFSLGPAVSAYGGSVVFTSAGRNLVDGDTNGVLDVFVHDLADARTTRVSVATDGTQGSALSGAATAGSVSADGTRIAFHSFAPEFAPGDTNHTLDGFVRDRTANRTILVSQSRTGGVGRASSFVPRISADGHYAAFDSVANDLVQGDGNGTSDVFVRDLELGTTRLVTRGPGDVQGNGYSTALGISADGGRVVLTSEATNLVPGDTNGTWDVFVTGVPLHWTAEITVGGTEGFTATIPVEEPRIRKLDDGHLRTDLVSRDGERFLELRFVTEHRTGTDVDGKLKIDRVGLRRLHMELEGDWNGTVFTGRGTQSGKKRQETVRIELRST
jgi:Tol biopolymer transport system component